MLAYSSEAFILIYQTARLHILKTVTLTTILHGSSLLRGVPFIVSLLTEFFFYRLEGLHPLGPAVVLSDTSKSAVCSML